MINHGDDDDGDDDDDDDHRAKLRVSAILKHNGNMYPSVSVTFPITGNVQNNNGS